MTDSANCLANGVAYLGGMELALELQGIYESEINIRIGWLWDGGIDVALGDDMNWFSG